MPKHRFADIIDAFGNNKTKGVTNMKKIIAILIALAAILSFAACGNNTGADETTTTTTEAPAAQLSGTLEEIASQVLAKTTKIEMALMDPMEVDFSDVEVAKTYIGIDPTDKVERAVFSEPMIGAIPYSMCLIKAKDGVDVEALKNEILEGVNYRKWICVAAEKVLVTNCGDTIMMVMSTEEIVDDVYNAFNTVASDAASEPITKAGEVNEEPPVEDGGIADMDVPADMPAYDGDMPAADGEMPAEDGIVLA